MVFHKLKAIRHQLIQTNKFNKLFLKPIIIIVTVAIGVLLQWLVFHDSNNDGKADFILLVSSFFGAENSFYYTKYTVSFLRSAIFLLLCHAAINLTSSYRVICLMFFVITSMLMDLGSIISTNFYYMVKAARYTDLVSFRDLYTLFEAACVLYTFIDWTLDRISNKHEDKSNNNNISRYHGGFTSRSSKSDHARQEKTSQSDHRVKQARQ